MRIQSLLSAIERAIGAITIGAAWILLPLLISVRTYDIVAGRFISTPGTYLQYVEWRGFTLLVMMGLGYAYLRDSHVRIDLLKARWSLRGQAWIEVVGYWAALVPFCLVIIWYGSEFALQSYDQAEREVAAFGRPVQWVVKSFIPSGALLLLLSGTVVFMRHALFLLGRAAYPGTEQENSSPF